MSASLETTTTSFIESAGIRFAYRRMGSGTGLPLILLQHFTGTMDSWDPALVNALARNRTVIAFNNAGVGSSSGTPPDNIEQMARDAEAFLRALALPRVDLLGFSLGGFIAQLLAAERPDLVRRLIVAGSAPPGGEEHLLAVVQEASSHHEAADIRLPLFFTPTPASQAAGRAFLARATKRVDGRDPESSEAVRTAQAKAIIAWCDPRNHENGLLKRITQPTLIVHGSDDTMFPSANAYAMFKAMSGAYLIIYPDSGHGALFQYPDTFVQHAQTFLDAV